MITITLKSVYCRLLLLAAVCLRSLKPTTGDICRAIKGPIPATNSYTWFIPLNPIPQSATFDVQVGHDFRVALVPDRNLIPSPTYTKYKVAFGEFSNTWSSIGENLLYNGAVLNANRTVALWLSWGGGVIAAGTGKIVGQNKIMSAMDPSPSPVNYMLIGGCDAVGNVTVNYCYGFVVFDRMVPIDLSYVTTSELTVLDCGRRCAQDPMCAGYSVVRDVSPVGNTACNVYYSISGRQYDPQHVTYVYGDGTNSTF